MVFACGSDMFVCVCGLIHVCVCVCVCVCVGVGGGLQFQVLSAGIFSDFSVDTLSYPAPLITPISLRICCTDGPSDDVQVCVCVRERERERERENEGKKY